MTTVAITLALITAALPPGMRCKSINKDTSFQCDFEDVRNTPDAMKFHKMAVLRENLLKAGVPEELINARFTFKGTDGNTIQWPSLFVNTKLTERQEQAHRASQAVQTVEQLQAQMAALVAQVAALTGKETPPAETPAEAVQPF